MACRSVQKKLNSTNGIKTQIKIGEQNLETVDSFKYLGAIVSEEGSKPEIMSRIAQTTASLKRLKTIGCFHVTSRELGSTSAAIFVITQYCNNGKQTQHPSSIRYNSSSL